MPAPLYNDVVDPSMVSRVREVMLALLLSLWSATEKRGIAAAWHAITSTLEPVGLGPLVQLVRRHEMAPVFTAWVRDLADRPGVRIDVQLGLHNYSPDGYLLVWDVVVSPDAAPQEAHHTVAVNAGNEAGRQTLQVLADSDMLLFMLMAGENPEASLEVSVGQRGVALFPALFPRQWRVCVPYAWPREQRQRCRDLLRAIEAQPLTGDWEAMLRRFGQEREDLPGESGSFRGTVWPSR